MANDPLTEIASWLRDAKFAVVFTGAGMSTESGIADFRSPDGVWSKYQPVYYHEFVSSLDARIEHWRQKAEAHREFADAKPNVGHRIISNWEFHGRIRGVITQNIDGLHQLAGNKNVLELHGTAREVSCLQCGKRFAAEPMIQQFLATRAPPLCDVCQGMTKLATVAFGQAMPAAIMQEAYAWSRRADLFLVFGSSLVVEPAASLPRIAKENGARLVIVNRDFTPLDDSADVVLQESIGVVLTSLERLALNHEPARP